MNKMDQTTYSREYLFQELTEKYHENCLDFSMPVTPVSYTHLDVYKRQKENI